MRTILLGLVAFSAMAAVPAWSADGAPDAAAVPVAPRDVPGPFSCRVVFPSDRAGQAEPLLSVGTGSAGDVIFVYYHPDGRISLGWEQPGWGVIFSDPLAAAPGQPHRLLLALGSLVPGGDSAPEYAALRDTALVQFDGRTVLTAHGSFQPFSPGRAFVGANVVGGAVAGAFFSGRLTDLAPVDPREVVTAGSTLASFLEPRAAQTPAGPSEGNGIADYPGPVLIRVHFPRGLAGQSEPLVVTGKTGAGDIVYVRFDNDHQLRFGYDHWSVGGPISDPVEIDPDRNQEIVVSMGSMQPPAPETGSDAYARLRHQCLVFVNGQRVLRYSSRFYPTLPTQIFIAANPIGGSTTGTKFSGVIVHVESMRPEDIPAFSP